MVDRDEFYQLITRVDERTAAIKEKVDSLKQKIESLESELSSTYVTQDQFAPVKSIVYGLVGIILTAVTTAIVYLVVK